MDLKRPLLAFAIVFPSSLLSRWYGRNLMERASQDSKIKTWGIPDSVVNGVRKYESDIKLTHETREMERALCVAKPKVLDICYSRR